PGRGATEDFRFMESLLAHVGMTKNMGINGSDIKGDVKVAMIATRATASVAAERLTKRDCSG
ncbi:MAG: hypothetical protein P8Y27_03210, partial [Chromatiaceae bacterium]